MFKAKKLTDHLTRIAMPGRVFTYIVEGSKCALLIDTGCGLGSFRTFVEEQLKGKPYEVVLTHGHVDHSGGSSEFDKVWLNEADWNIAAEHTQLEVRKSYLLGNRDAGTKDFNEKDLIAPKTEGYLPLQYGQTFELGDETVEIACLGGHTPGAVAVLLKDERILLTGDACCSYALLFSRGSLKVSEYKAHLQKFLQQYEGQYDTVIYSHPHNFGGVEVIPQMIELCDEVLEHRDDHISVTALTCEGYLAKKCNLLGRRMDGKTANLFYTDKGF